MNIYTKKLKRKIKINRGYALLFSVLTATLVLGVAVFILSVSRKQFALAVAARESMYSLYAADSGIECAAAAYTLGTISTTSPANIQCGGTMTSSASWTQSALPGWSSSPQPYQSAPMNIGLTNGTCARVVVTTGFVGSKILLEIESRGYNYCNSSTNIPQISSRTVERALVLTYQ